MRLGRLSIENDKRRLRPGNELDIAMLRFGGGRSVLDLQGGHGMSAEDPDTWARHDVTRVVFYESNQTPPERCLEGFLGCRNVNSDSVSFYF